MGTGITKECNSFSEAESVTALSPLCHRSILTVSRFSIRNTSFHLQNLFLAHFLISFIRESNRSRTVNIVFNISADIHFHFSLDYQLFQPLKESMSLTPIMIIVTFIFSSFSNVVQIFFSSFLFSFPFTICSFGFMAFYDKSHCLYCYWVHVSLKNMTNAYYLDGNKYVLKTISFESVLLFKMTSLSDKLTGL